MHVILPQPGPNFTKTQFVPVRSIKAAELRALEELFNSEAAARQAK